MPVSLAHLMILHVAIDHEWPMERIERVREIVLMSGETVWGLGSRGRKKGYLAVWRVAGQSGRPAGRESHSASSVRATESTAAVTPASQQGRQSERSTTSGSPAPEYWK